ncbi:MAG TPA: M4 family metallopeptidase, partial [Ilumatobacteraceae bacterium]|nr:M4 family metallopeptidase [Ilumatobacteraceae bacterium]
MVLAAVLTAVVAPLGSGTLSATAIPAPDPGSSEALLNQLQDSAGGTAEIAVSPETGAVTFIGGSAGRSLEAAVGGQPTHVARQFVDQYGLLFGVVNPTSELTQMNAFTADSGDSAIRYQQTYRGVPVFAGEIAVQLDSTGRVQSTSGEALPTPDVDVAAQVSAAAAAAVAIDITAKYDHVDRGLLSAATPQLWIYDPSLIGADGLPGTRLVWRTDVRTELGDVDRLVLIDAHSGTVALQFSQRESALNRLVCSNGNVPANQQSCTTANDLRSEGSLPLIGVDQQTLDVNSAYDLSGVTYNFYAGLGRDSIDGAGLQLRSTVLYCSPVSFGDPCPLDNAFWNGAQMVYGESFAGADDVVGHELTHGVTDATSRLLYYGESGAINESMSDVMGELIDLGNGIDQPADNWLLGEDLPIGEIRSMINPPSFGDPDKMTSTLYFGGPQDSHGVHTNSGVDNKAAYLIAQGDTFNGHTVVGLGLAKTAQIYYAAETTLLGPGSDYLDLFHILPQACTNSVGTAGITAGDCNSVVEAVAATEMDKFPTTAGAHLSAPICDAGAVQTSTLFSDNMEANNGNWTSAATAGTPQWGYFTGSSQSGTKSLHGADFSSTAQSILTGGFSVAVPSGTTYLRFDHSFEMDSDSQFFYDGGVAEYSTDGGTVWHDAVTLPGPTINGYNGTLRTGLGNPLAGRQAFSGASPGYETTRISLGSLTGSNVKIRFRLGSDSSIGASGWFIDDLSVYTCAAAPTSPNPQTSFVSLVPGRLLESRGGQSTVDGLFNGVGLRGAGSVTALPVLGRGGVGGDADAVVLNVTVTDPQAAGFVTVFPCGSAQPNASSLNYVAGATVANAVVVKVGDGGQVCLFTQSATHLIADVNGYFPAGSGLASLVPGRLLESRGGQATVDGLFNGVGLRGAGSVTAL